MKILHASHTHMKTLGARNYLLPVRINNGFIRNNHEVFWFSDRDVARYSSFLGSRKTGVRSCNRKFLEVCRNFEPDVIALCSADIISPDTLAVARRLLPNVAIFQYYIDPLFIKENDQNVRSKVEVVDYTFVTTAGEVLRRVAGSHSKAAFIPNPVDASIDTQRCHERSDQAFDVFFAGHRSPWSDPDDLRLRFPQILQAQLPGVRVSAHGLGFGESLYGAAFMHALGDARIGLNFSQRTSQAVPGPGGELYFYSSDRVGLFLGNGLLVFSTGEFNLAGLYGEDALVEVSGADDFIDKLRFYTEHDDERMVIARTGYQRAHDEFNERLVAQFMLEATLEQPLSHAYQWPTESYRR
ncbi:MAG: glycosyltransferase [Gammaproteobacteria bacterium]|nr:glycosyltransferase [Gammaproteobacteria bacterium]